MTNVRDASLRVGPLEVGIVAHTHWDREWYEPFQTFRAKLVKLLDALIPMLEKDPAFRRFLLDGQTQVIDDYLAIRPEMQPRLQALAESGRVSVGPWMILMDEFMVSGETMIRDLQFGIERANEFGGLMEVGYLPDMFGHVAQMPQLLQLGGFTDAVLWRGVPNVITESGFWWESPDGSRVRVEYLYGSYSNASALPDSVAGLIELTREYEDELGDGRIGDLLLMNGTDHQMALPWLGRVVEEANATQLEYHFAVTSLADYLSRQPRDGLSTWHGELRSGARANLLMGVASNRVDVHRRAAAAERALERRAEPLGALYLDGGAYPVALLRRAWKRLVLNAAHDSSCACSHDETVEQVNVRYAEARQIADGVVIDALNALAATVDAPRSATIVANPTARSRPAVIELSIPGRGAFHFVSADGRALPSQLISEGTGVPLATVVQGNKIHWLLKIIRNALGAGLSIASVEVVDVDTDFHRVTLNPALSGEPTVDVEPVLGQLRAWGEAGHTLHVTQTGQPTRTVAVATDVVPGFGWSTLTLASGQGPGGQVRSDGVTIENDQISVTINPADATYTIETADGVRCEHLGRIVDGGDGGDTYNYSPPTVDRLVDSPTTVAVTLSETGPVRARAEIHADYAWPTHAVGDARRCEARAEQTTDVTIRTTLELRTGEPFVRVRHAFDNAARDHRLRAHFPLPARVAGSDAECAFTVVHRGLAAEGSNCEYPLPTFPSRRFVDCSDGVLGLALIHDGLLEYEVLDGGTELALTLLRATGWLSRSEFAYRLEGAGPNLATPGAQLVGPFCVEYAVYPHRGDWRDADLYGAADAVLVPFERTRGMAPDAPVRRPVRGCELQVDGAEVTALLRDEGQLVVRVVRSDAASGVARITRHGTAARGVVVDLRGNTIDAFDGEIRLNPWQIATIRLT